jgi:hypothetical protein
LKHILIFLIAPYLDCLKIQDYFVENTVAYISNHHFNKEEDFKRLEAGVMQMQILHSNDT